MIFYFYRHSDVKRMKVDENIEIKITKKISFTEERGSTENIE